MRRTLGIGLIGAGFMGVCHALAFRTAPALFPDGPDARLEVIADLDSEVARGLASRFGFARATDDWRVVVADPAVDIVAVTAPNALHREMTLAALAAGKHVYCEKPMAVTLEDAAAMADAADKAGVVTLVGYNYLRSPAVAFTRKLVEEGAIGRPTYFRGLSDEDYMASPDAPFSWRCRRDLAGTGALGDIGSHILSFARYLIGPVRSVSADRSTIIADRPVTGSAKQFAPLAAGADAPRAPVENEDIVHAMLRFDGGIIGTIATSRVAWGRKNHLAFELYGTEGGILFDQERMNELLLFQPSAAGSDRNGFRKILFGPDHPPYGAFLPAPGHGLGFNDLKAAEVGSLLAAIGGGAPAWPDFRQALEIERTLHAIDRATTAGTWVDVPH